MIAQMVCAVMDHTRNVDRGDHHRKDLVDQMGSFPLTMGQQMARYPLTTSFPSFLEGWTVRKNVYVVASLVQGRHLQVVLPQRLDSHRI